MAIGDALVATSPSTSAPAAPQPPKQRQRFEILRKLGSGTYGKVSLAYDHKTDEEVAVKIIKKSAIENQQDLLRIRREIRIMSALSHPNIIEIKEVFENTEKIIIVMEYASGGELYDHISTQGSLNEDSARKLFREIVSAVFYCHKHQVAHRDLKLENILLDGSKSAKIADFGLSNYFSDGNLLKTFCGSPLYASPEIINGTPYRGPEVDCWSLGVLLYTLVYGSMPFDGRDFNRMVRQIKRGAYYEPDIPSSASMLIRSMLRVNHDRRADIDTIAGHWWLNFSCDDVTPISDMPENQVLDPTPLIDREETMIVQKMKEDESDIFAEYTFINSSTRKKIEEFRRRRRHESSQDMSVSESIPPPRASRSKRVHSKDRGSVEPPPRHRSGARRPPVAATPEGLLDSETYTDPLSRLKALEQRLDDMVTRAHTTVENAHRPPRPPRREKSPGFLTETAQRPLRVTAAGVTEPVEIARPTSRAPLDQGSPDTQLANRLINELLEESAKGTVPQFLIDKIRSSHVYESKPQVQEIFAAIVSSQEAPAAEPSTVNLDEPIPHDNSYTAVVTDRQPSPTRVTIPGTEEEASQGQSEELGHQTHLPDDILPIDEVVVQSSGVPRIYSGATSEPLPDVIQETKTCQPATAPLIDANKPLSKLVSAKINVIIAEKPDVIVAKKPPIAQISEASEGEDEEVEDEEEDEFDEETDESSVDTEEILKPIYTRLGEGEETVHSVSDFEDLDIEEEEIEKHPELDDVHDPVSEAESYASAMSHQQLPQTPSTAPAIVGGDTQDNAFLRGLSKRQSRGKYEKTKFVYGRSISIDETPLHERKRIGGVQPQIEEADQLFEKAEQYILQYPDQPPTPELETVTQAKAIQDAAANKWLKTADPDLSNSSFECESPLNGKKTPTPQDPQPEKSGGETRSRDYYTVLWPPKADGSSSVSTKTPGSSEFKLQPPPPPRKNRRNSDKDHHASPPSDTPADPEPRTPKAPSTATSSKLEGDIFQFPAENEKQSPSPTDTSREREPETPSNYRKATSPGGYSRRTPRRPRSRNDNFDTAARLLTDTNFITRTPHRYETSATSGRYDTHTSTGYDGGTTSYGTDIFSPTTAAGRLDTHAGHHQADDLDNPYRRHSYRSAVEKKEDRDPFYTYTTTHTRPLTEYVAKRYDSTYEPSSTASKYAHETSKTTDPEPSRYGMSSYVRPRYNNDIYRTGYFNRSTEEEPRTTTRDTEYTPYSTSNTNRLHRKHSDEYDADVTGGRSRSSRETSPERDHASSRYSSRTTDQELGPGRRGKSKSLYDTTEESPLSSVYRYEPKTLTDSYGDRSQYPSSGRYYQSSTAYDRTGSTNKNVPTYGDTKLRSNGGYRSRYDDNVSYRRSYYDPSHYDVSGDKDKYSAGAGRYTSRLWGNRRRSKSLERDLAAAARDTDQDKDKDASYRPTYRHYQYHDTGTGSRDVGSSRDNSDGPVRSILKKSRRYGSSEDDQPAEYGHRSGRSTNPTTDYGYSGNGSRIESSNYSKNYEAPSSTNKRSPLRFMDRLFARKTPERRGTEGPSGSYDREPPVERKNKRFMPKISKRSYSLGEDKYRLENSTDTEHSAPHSPLDKIKGMFSYNSRSKENLSSSHASTPERRYTTSTRADYGGQPSTRASDYRSPYKPMSRFWYEDSNLY